MTIVTSPSLLGKQVIFLYTGGGMTSVEEGLLRVPVPVGQLGVVLVQDAEAEGGLRHPLRLPLQVVPQRLKGPLHAQEKQLVLPGVVVVHHAFGYPVAPADLFHGGPVVAVGAEFLQGRLIDLLPAALLPLLLCHGLRPPFSARVPAAHGAPLHHMRIVALIDGSVYIFFVSRL